MIELLEALLEMVTNIDHKAPWTVKIGVPIVSFIIFYNKWKESRMKQKRNDEMRNDIKAIKNHLGVPECANTSTPTNDPLVLLGKGGYMCFLVGVSIARYVSRFTIYLIRRVLKMQNANWATLIPAIFGALKLVFQSFGIDLSGVTDAQVNDAANGVAALLVIGGIIYNHFKNKGAGSNVNAKSTGDHGPAV